MTDKVPNQSIGNGLSPRTILRRSKPKSQPENPNKPAPSNENPTNESPTKILQRKSLDQSLMNKQESSLDHVANLLTISVFDAASSSGKKVMHCTPKGTEHILDDMEYSDVENPVTMEVQPRKILRRDCSPLTKVILPPPKLRPYKSYEQRLHEYEEKRLEIFGSDSETIIDMEVTDEKPSSSNSMSTQADSHPMPMVSQPTQMLLTKGIAYDCAYDSFYAAGHNDAHYTQLTTIIDDPTPTHFYTPDGSVHFYQPQHFYYLPASDENKTVIVSKAADDGINENY